MVWPKRNRFGPRADPYEAQNHAGPHRSSAQALNRLGRPTVSCAIRAGVGPLELARTRDPMPKIRRARLARKRAGVIVAPIAFVSEHSETLVELDIDYGTFSPKASGVPHYVARPQPSARHQVFIAGACRLGPTGSRSATGDLPWPEWADNRIGPGRFALCSAGRRYDDSAGAALFRGSKALHIISVDLAWIGGGLLYLPRLFVYHAGAPTPGSEGVRKPSR